MRDKDLYAGTLNIGRAMELEVVIGPGDAGAVGLRVLCSPGEEGQTTISVYLHPYGDDARLVSLTAYRMASVWPEFERDQLRCRGVAR